MTSKPDEHFYDRADAHIALANEQTDSASRGKVSASFLYAAARFNAWVSACGFKNADEMRAAKEVTVDYLLAQYRAMLAENLDDYADHFEKYMRPPDGSA